MTKNRVFDGVQTLRFIAALLVVITHSTLYAHERLDPQISLWERGSVGVDIFFVISGFVMIVSSAHLTAANFAQRRLIRIVPLYWAITTFKVAVLLAAPALALHAAINWPYVVKSYFFLPAFNSEGRIEPIHGVGWTLTFEMFFYALFTIGLALRVRIVPFVAVILGLCFGISLFRQPDWPAWTVYFDSRVLGFLGGMLIGKYFTAVRVSPAVATGLVAIGALCVALLPWTPGELSTVFTHVLPSCFIVMGFVGLEPALRGQWPRMLTFLGAASYSLYLVHPIIAPIAPVLLKKLSITSGSLSVTLSVTIATVGAIFVYRFLEKPTTDFLTALVSPKGAASKRPATDAAKA